MAKKKKPKIMAVENTPADMKSDMKMAKTATKPMSKGAKFAKLAKLRGI